MRIYDSITLHGQFYPLCLARHTHKTLCILASGNQSEECQGDIETTHEILPQRGRIEHGRIECQLNSVPFMNLATIRVTTKCQLSNVVRCSINQHDIQGNFGPEDPHQTSAAWVPYEAMEPHHIIMLQLRDIVSNSDTKVKIKAVSRTGNHVPFFSFTILNRTTGIHT